MQAVYLSFFLFLSSMRFDPGTIAKQGGVVIDSYGAIIRGEPTRKQIALVLTGDAFADGGEMIRKVFIKHHIKASFFLTGNFYQNTSFGPLIHALVRDGHYLGAHSEKHLLYADWQKRDSLLVNEEVFKKDLLLNYERMASFGITKEEAPYFLPPFEWYNAQIARWTSELGLQLVNFSPGTRSTADYTYPEMGNRYVPSDVIYRSIMDLEKKDAHGLNGFILLIHIGTDPRRTDKFYYKLDAMVRTLTGKEYRFVTITQLLGQDK
jgi:endoglucanase